MANKDDERFVLVYEHSMGGHAFAEIVADKMTGVQYLLSTTFHNASVGNGLTVLVDKDGKPLLYQPPEE